MIIHTRPSPIRISKMLLPTALLTAISPLPCRATIMEAIISGTEVPTASTVKPMITPGTPNAVANATPASTNTQLSSTITTIDMPNVTRKRRGCFSTLGMRRAMIQSTGERSMKRSGWRAWVARSCSLIIGEASVAWSS